LRAKQEAMKSETTPKELIKKMLDAEHFLIVQDIDGVCIPLVKDPLERKISISYIEAANKLNGQFYVLTNGEHEGSRGVNRVIEEAYKIANLPFKKDRYLPGLAAGGIEFQDTFGVVDYPGVSEDELEFLQEIPKKMELLLYENLSKIFSSLKPLEIRTITKSAILSTRFSPTINLNKIFNLIPNDVAMQQDIQRMLEKLMDKLLLLAAEQGLQDSFFLHIAPNLGKRANKEVIKFSSIGDVGTTDIQFMLSGAIKEAGLLALINRFIKARSGRAPLGDDFNVRTAPKSFEKLKALCKEKITANDMPLLIGVGDTVTSNLSADGKAWLRGGSDRGFLTLIQELGKEYSIQNKIVLVDSSFGEVDRPSLSNNKLRGISDPEDPLKFNTYFRNGPKEYVEWFSQLAEERRR